MAFSFLLLGLLENEERMALDGRVEKKVFAMQKVNVCSKNQSPSIYVSRKGKYQFFSCLLITYDQNIVSGIVCCKKMQ